MTLDVKVDFEQRLEKGIQEIPSSFTWSLQAGLGATLLSPNGLILYFMKGNHQAFSPPPLTHYPLLSRLVETSLVPPDVEVPPLIRGQYVHQPPQAWGPHCPGPYSASYPSILLSPLLSSSPLITSPRGKPKLASPVYTHIGTCAHCTQSQVNSPPPVT